MTRLALRVEPLEPRDVPAVLFVDDSFGITSDVGEVGLTEGDRVTFNAGLPGEVVGLEFGTAAFDDLETALASSEVDDTIRLASGTFVVRPGLEIGRSVSVEGFDVASTRIVPAGNTDVQGEDRALIRVAPGVNFNLARLTIDGRAGSRSVAEAVRYAGGNGTIRGVVFENIAADPSLSEEDGIAVTAQNGELFVRDSRFVGVGRTAVLATGPAMRLYYAANTASGSGGGTRFGVELSDGAAGVVTGSRFSGYQGAAVLVDSSASPNTRLTLIGNEFEANLTAVRVGIAPTDTSLVSARFNNFVGNTSAVSSSFPAVDAANNFWGSASGPREAGNPGGAGDAVDVRVDYAPFNTQRFARAAGSTIDEYLAAVRTPLAVAAGPGGEPIVAVYDAEGTLTRAVLAYDRQYLGGVNVALGDVTGDGVIDLVTGSATGAAHVKIFDGVTGSEVASFFAFDPLSRVGVTVATGDTDGDGYQDLILGASSGGLPIVRVYQGGTGLFSRAFLAFDERFRGGVDVASADLDRAGRDLILVSPFTRGVGVVRAFDVSSEAEVAREFAAFDGGEPVGLSVASGDIDGDGVPDLIASTSGVGVSRVRVLSGRDGGSLRDLTAGEARSRSGARASSQSVGFTAAHVLAYTAPERAGTRALVQRLDGGGTLRTLTPFGAFAGPLDLA